MLVVSIPLSVFLVMQRQEVRKSAAPATVLSLSPGSGNYQEGETFTVNVNVSTGENLITGADLFLSYNPVVLEAIQAQIGSFLTNPSELKNQIDTSQGRIILSLGSTDEPKQGSGTLATITFLAKSAGSSDVEFDSLTSVGGVGEQEALSQTQPASYVVQAVDPVNTPTPTATPTQSPGEPTSTPTPTTSQAEEEVTPMPTPTQDPQSPSDVTPTPTVQNTTQTTTTKGGEEIPVSGTGLPTVLILTLSGLLIFGSLILI